MAGAEVRQHTPVTALSASGADGTWDVHVENGDPIHAEHVVNAGGLWAREVGRFVGIELPVLAMEHHYLLTENMPEVADYVAQTGHEMPMALDFAGEIYIRQEGGAMLLGTYEQDCRPWSPRETPWDFGSQLLKPDLERIAPELQVAFKHYPAMGTIGIKRVVNGPFTFAPGREPARRSRPRPARLLGRVRRHGRAVAGRRRRARAGDVDDRAAMPATPGWISGRWTSPATATTRTSPTRTRRSRRTTGAGSGSRSRTRSCRRRGRC